MRNKLVLPLLIVGAVACSTKESSVADDTSAGKGMLTSSVETEKGRDESLIIQSTAVVEKIDYQTREVTLKTADNRTVNFKAGPQVQRLNEIKVGDTVLAEYSATLSFEVRPPTPEELANPTTSLSLAERAPKTSAPAAALARGVHTIVTVTNLDRTAKTVTVKDQNNKLHTVKAQNEERFNKMKVGDTVAVTYAEALGISLQKQ